MVKLSLVMAVFSLAVEMLPAQVPAEVPALDSVNSGSGTRLVAAPTFIYEHPAEAAGLMDVNTLWNPERSSARSVLDRYPGILQWQRKNSAAWFYTGNEIGDLLYQELTYPVKSSNRTPMLDLGVTSDISPQTWFTLQGSQVDHFSSAAYNTRLKTITQQDFSWFGENLATYSTIFAGGGLRYGEGESNLLAGGEYLWVLTPSQRWIPMQILPRIQMQSSWGSAFLHLSYERQSFEDHILDTIGLREEWNGTLRYTCSDDCQSSILQLGAGISFRHASDTGAVPWGMLENGTQVWPWVEARAHWKPWIRWAGHAGSNQRDHLLRDSLEFHFKVGSASSQVGWFNSWGTTPNPLREDYEKIGTDSIALHPENGYEQLQKLYARFAMPFAPFEWSGSAWAWADHGAETFIVDKWKNVGYSYRTGSMGRVNRWLTGEGARARLGFAYHEWFRLSAEGGWETWQGPAERLEVEPSQGWAKFAASWKLFKTLDIDHEWVYRSAAQWNLRDTSTFQVPGGWTWNASIREHIPAYRLTLQATWLHVFAPNKPQAPNGGFDRTRFYCGVRKEF